jgi:hypothetical protein
MSEPIYCEVRQHYCTCHDFGKRCDEVFDDAEEEEEKVSDTPRTDKCLAQRVTREQEMSWSGFAGKLERDLREAVAALKLAYPLLTDKSAREEIGELLNRIEGK